MFKTSQQFYISSLCQLPCSACQTGPPGPLTPESTAGRYADNGRCLEGAMMIPLHMKRHLYYQEIAVTQHNCVVLTNLFRFVIKSWFISLVSSLWLSSCLFFALLVLLPLIIFLAHVDFFILPSFVPARSPFSPLRHPSCLSLRFHTRFPHPDRRSNSLSTASSKWFQPPSPLSPPANDVPPSITLWCWLP